MCKPSLRKGGGGRPSVNWACVVQACVYLASCMCSRENNAVDGTKMATQITVSATQQKRDEPLPERFSSVSVGYKEVLQDGVCYCVISIEARLCVFESRLKIRTGRARFRETGKLMQGSGARHQPAHCSLGWKCNPDPKKVWSLCSSHRWNSYFLQVRELVYSMADQEFYNRGTS